MKVFRVSKTAALFFASLIAITVPAFVQASQDDEIAAIRNVIATSMSNLDVDSIEPSAVDGLYEITLANAQVIFASADARYFIPGDLFEVTPLGVINRGETRRNELRAEKIAAVPETEMIIFEAEGERKAALTFSQMWIAPGAGSCTARLSVLMNWALLSGIWPSPDRV
jgi:thiol:disulfide interchange protein DsbC